MYLLRDMQNWIFDRLSISRISVNINYELSLNLLWMHIRLQGKLIVHVLPAL